MPFPLRWSQQVSLIQGDVCVWIVGSGWRGGGGDTSRGLGGGGMEPSRTVRSSRKDPGCVGLWADNWANIGLTSWTDAVICPDNTEHGAFQYSWCFAN